jgi:hypothetical protein
MSEAPEKTTHGGKRRGAGRPKKWDFSFVVKVGQACEKLNRKAMEESLDQQKNDLFRQRTELEWHWAEVNKVPPSKRRQFLTSETFEVHSQDVNEELKMLASKKGGEVNRVIQLKAKAPRGTRTKILQQVAKTFGLTTKQVDNMWQAYRRFEAEEISET